MYLISTRKQGLVIEANGTGKEIGQHWAPHADCSSKSSLARPWRSSDKDIRFVSIIGAMLNHTCRVSSSHNCQHNSDKLFSSSRVLLRAYSGIKPEF